MRPRTFILLILVIVVAAAAAIWLFVLRPGDGLFGGGAEEAPPAVEQPAEAEVGQEPGAVAATPTPEVSFVPVVVAAVNLPVGERIRLDLIRIETRPETNVAVVAGVTFSEAELVVGQIVKTAISEGQEILRPMIALNPSDITTLGSDLALYIDQGKVAVAFPMDRFSGAAFAMRPGDLVDAFMSLQMVDLDEEFQSALPNIVQRVNESALLEGQAFLFPPTNDGRLELIPIINNVALIAPGTEKEPIPRRVTQLTLQQMEVLWVGSWLNPNSGMTQEYKADAFTTAELAAFQEQLRTGTYPPNVRFRPEVNPDVVILSMSSQDALALKWALETGISIDLVLRAQGDTSVFVTTSVSLPQIFEQGVLVAPEPSDVGLQPRVDEVSVPALPVAPPQ